MAVVGVLPLLLQRLQPSGNECEPGLSIAGRTQLSEHERPLLWQHGLSIAGRTQLSEHERPLLWQHGGPPQLRLSQQPDEHVTPHDTPPRELLQMMARTFSPLLRTCPPTPTSTPTSAARPLWW